MNLNNVKPKWVKDQDPYILMITTYLRTIGHYVCPSVKEVLEVDPP